MHFEIVFLSFVYKKLSISDMIKDAVLLLRFGNVSFFLSACIFIFYLISNKDRYF